MTKKIETAITLKNGGMHSPARYRAFKKIILNNDYKKVRLYQLILTGSTAPESYSKAADGIARLLRKNSIRCTGKGAWEVDEDKGLHFHFFLLVEAEHGRVDHWLGVAEDGPLKTMLRKLGVKVHIAPPRNDMHRTMSTGEMPLYQYVSKSGPKLQDALVRISYLYKNRSKDLTMKRVYYSTREKAVKQQPAPAVQAECLVQAATTNIEQGDNDMNMTNLTPAGFRYLGGLYESCIDAGMDVGAIFAHLTRKGVSVTRAEVVHHLDHVFKFHRYAETHPAKPILTYAQADAEMRRPARRAVTVGSELVSFDLPSKQPSCLDQKILDSTYDLAHNCIINL